LPVLQTVYFSGVVDSAGAGVYAVEPDGTSRFLRSGRYAYLQGLADGRLIAGEVNSEAGTTTYRIHRADGSVESVLGTVTFSSMQQVLSPDRTRVASFYGAPEGVSIKDFAGSTEIRIPTGFPTPRTLDWTADGGILVETFSGGAFSVATVEPEAGAVLDVVVPNAMTVESASFGRHGNEVLYLEAEGAEGDLNVHLKNVSTGEVETLGSGKYGLTFRPRVSRSGDAVYFTAAQWPQTDRLLIRLDASTGRFTDLTVPGTQSIETLSYNR
jgi:hypothetical protein